MQRLPGSGRNFIGAFRDEPSPHYSFLAPRAAGATIQHFGLPSAQFEPAIRNTPCRNELI